MTALLDVRGLEASYGPTQVIFGIDFAVAARGVTTILGANGAGKTTTLRAVSRMVKTAGQVMLEGQDIGQLSTEDITRCGVAHVPDGRGTFTGLTVDENLRLGAYTRRDKDGVAEDQERVAGLFPGPCVERIHQQAGTLSGGEQQMLALARALMLRPKLMLLDEPSFGLAPRVVQDLFEIMRRINEEEGIGMLLVEQDAALALALADQAYLLETGRVAISGPADEIGKDDAVRKAYLGY